MILIPLSIPMPRTIYDMSAEQIIFLLERDRVDDETMEDGLLALLKLIEPIAINAAKKYTLSLGLTRDDILEEALEALWDIVRKKEYVPRVYHDGYVPAFLKFFRMHFSHRLYRIFHQRAFHYPLPVNMSWCINDEDGFKVTYDVCAFREDYILEHRAKQRRWNRNKKKEAKK